MVKKKDIKAQKLKWFLHLNRAFFAGLQFKKARKYALSLKFFFLELIIRIFGNVYKSFVMLAIQISKKRFFSHFSRNYIFGI